MEDSETWLSPSAAARTVSGIPSAAAVYYWIKHGILFQGRLVRLAAVRSGGRWYIERAALAVFLGVINGGTAPGFDCGPAGPPPLSRREARATARRRHEALMACGIVK